MSDKVPVMSPIVKRTRGDPEASTGASSTSTAKVGSEEGAAKIWWKNTFKSSTPVKSCEDASKSSQAQSEVNVSVPDPSSAELNVGLSDRSAKAENSVGSSGNVVEFDSTGSWYLENVNSYCAGVASATVGIEGAAMKKSTTFESTTSWFIESVNQYCGAKSKLVDYSCNSSSYLSEPRGNLCLSLTNEPRWSDRNLERLNTVMVVHGVVDVGTKGEGSSLRSHGENGFLLNVAGSSFLSHSVQGTEFSLPSLPPTSMVSHVDMSNMVNTQIQEPCQPEPVFDLWQHLVNISRSSFTRAIKRKNELDDARALCSSFEGLRLSIRKHESLESAMKRQCTISDGQKSDDSDGGAVQESDDSDGGAVQKSDDSDDIMAATRPLAESNASAPALASGTCDGNKSKEKDEDEHGVGLESVQLCDEAVGPQVQHQSRPVLPYNGLENNGKSGDKPSCCSQHLGSQ